MQEKITILMATYNGEKFLSDQLNSIINQTYSNWELWIRDDNSTDKTKEIITKYTMLDKRIKIYIDDLGNLGVVRNFGTLLENVHYDNFVMFSDQDDVWLPFKIETTLNRMKEEETRNRDEPILVFSLFEKVNFDLTKINTTKYTIPSDVNIYNVISGNFIYGCTMMLNRNLVNLVTPISNKAENHDYWIALIAAYSGKISLINKVTMLYRQHDTNVTGNYKNSSFKSRLNRLLKGNYQGIIDSRLVMIRSLIKHLKYKNINTVFLENYIENIEVGGYRAVMFILKNNLHKYGVGRLANIMNIVSSFTYNPNRKNDTIN